MNNQESILDRRSFLRHVSSTAMMLPLIGLGIVEFTSCARATGNSSGGSWRTSICADNEPGEPLIVSGTIFRSGRSHADGRNHSVGLSN
jgi:hypothetical protein